jgi:hypothetical protein|tara:strand:- start:720 stop:998 length:279 start_codon:yes stop_codon:yes gene_type:complete
MSAKALVRTARFAIVKRVEDWQVLLDGKGVGWATYKPSNGRGPLEGGTVGGWSLDFDEPLNNGSFIAFVPGSRRDLRRWLVRCEASLFDVPA